MVMDVTRQLAEFAASIRYDALPQEVRVNAKLAIADSVGTALAGIEDPAVRLLRETAIRESRSGQATVLGCGMRLTAAHAAFSNAAAAHAHDFDSISLAVSGFVATPVLFALLAVADEIGGVSGRALLEAFVAGYETEAAIARGVGVLHYAKGWHSTATLAHFGAAVAVGRLLRLDVEQMRSAIGIAAAEASGLRNVVGNMLKVFHVGKAARNGVTAGYLARSGFKADPSAVEGKGGFCVAFNGEGNYDLGRITRDLGRAYDLVDPGLVLKIYPCCGLLHSALDGVLDLVAEHKLAPAQVRRARIAVHELVPATTANSDPQTGYDGKWSAAFCVATALTEGAVRMRHFADDRIRDPRLRVMMAKTEMVVHPELRSHETFLYDEFSDVTLTLASGEVLERRVMRMNNRGSKGRPLTFGELKSKYLDCVASYPRQDAALHAFDRLASLEDVRDVSEVAALLQ